MRCFLLFLFICTSFRLQAMDPIQASPGLKVYKSGETYVAVYLPSSYDGSKLLPLVVSSHGNGGKGPEEIKSWIKAADDNGWIIVCPTFASPYSHTPDIIKKDADLMDDVMKEVFSSLKVDRDHVLATGFSGGGYPVWFVAADMPKVFTALCLRSANFSKQLPIDMKKWKDRPVYVFWGSAETTHAATEDGPAAMNYLEERVKPKKLKHEVIAGGGHDSRVDLAAAWFADVIKGL